VGFISSKFLIKVQKS